MPELKKMKISGFEMDPIDVKTIKYKRKFLLCFFFAVIEILMNTEKLDRQTIMFYLTKVSCEDNVLIVILNDIFFYLYNSIAYCYKIEYIKTIK